MNANRTPIPHADVTKKIVRFSYNGNKRPCVQPRSKKHPGTDQSFCYHSRNFALVNSSFESKVSV